MEQQEEARQCQLSRSGRLSGQVRYFNSDVKMFMVSLSTHPRGRKKVNAFLRVRLESLRRSPVVYALLRIYRSIYYLLAEIAGGGTASSQLVLCCYSLISTFLFSFLFFSKIKEAYIHICLSPSYALDLQYKR